MVVETMKKEHLSIYAAMQEFGINDHKIIEHGNAFIWKKGRKACRLSDGAAAALVGQRSCQKRWKNICWPKCSDCVRRTITWITTTTAASGQS